MKYNFTYIDQHTDANLSKFSSHSNQTYNILSVDELRALVDRIKLN